MDTVYTATWDSLDIASLRARGQFKWSLFPEAIGAFIAEMDYGIAPPVAQAVHALVDQAQTGYLPKPLEAELGRATAGFMQRRYGWTVPADHVGAVPDVLKAFELAFTHFLPDGGPIVVPTPSYAPFLIIPKLHGREIIEVPCLQDGHGVYRLDEAALEAALAPKGGLLVLCSPHNPLGRVYSRTELERVSALVERTGARVFADEIHAPLTYAGHSHIPYASLSAETARHTVTGTSASKAWNIPGLTCAQMIFSKAEDASRFKGLGHFMTRGASNAGVVANIAAYDNGEAWLDTVMAHLDGNRLHLARRLAEALPGARFSLPEATYLAWIDLSGLTDRTELAGYIREHAGVAITGGEDCGAAGQGAIRLNFATPRPILDEVIDRLATLFSEK